MKIACDLDGTLAAYNGWTGITNIGEPIQPVLRRVKAALAAGYEVVIFTARMSCDDEEKPFVRLAIERWCEKHVGQKLDCTAVKSRDIDEFWDDRAVGVYKNTGHERVTYSGTLWRELGASEYKPFTPQSHDKQGVERVVG